jgi:hypothetical protein
MADELKSSDFIDRDYFEPQNPPAGTGSPGISSSPPPSREELDARAADVQQEIEKLRRAQEELERKKGALEETRRRRIEWETSKKELIHGLTRALGLLEKAEFNARQEAEQMAKALTGLRDALSKVQSINEESWTKDNFEIELTRALSVVENARQEWNSARLKFPIIDAPTEKEQAPQQLIQSGIKIPDFYELLKIGFAINFPLVIIILIAIIVILLKR